MSELVELGERLQAIGDAEDGPKECGGIFGTKPVRWWEPQVHWRCSTPSCRRRRRRSAYGKSASESSNCAGDTAVTPVKCRICCRQENPEATTTVPSPAARTAGNNRRSPTACDTA